MQLVLVVGIILTHDQTGERNSKEEERVRACLAMTFHSSPLG
jgi:hypothetical protein